MRIAWEAEERIRQQDAVVFTASMYNCETYHEVSSSAPHELRVWGPDFRLLENYSRLPPVITAVRFTFVNFR